MKIETVTYRRLKSHTSGFGHDAIEAAARVEKGETAEQAFEALRRWVLARLADVHQSDRAADKIEALDQGIAERERRLKAMGEQIDQAHKAVGASQKVQALLRAAGFKQELEDLFGEDEVPF